jgi:UDP-N-acetylmuramyl pentapeptide synthase
MVAALDAHRDARPRIAVLGEMLELGRRRVAGHRESAAAADLVTASRQRRGGEIAAAARRSNKSGSDRKAALGAILGRLAGSDPCSLEGLARDRLDRSSRALPSRTEAGR